jgi:hypothetical protein
MVKAALAPQRWLQKQSPLLQDRASGVEGGLGQNEARLQLVSGKANVALDRLDNLRVGKWFVLHLGVAAHFAFGPAAMT